MRSLRIILALTEPPLPFCHATSRWSYVLLKGLVERGHRVTAYAPCADAGQIDPALDLFPASHYDLRLYPHTPRARTINSKLQTLRRPYSYIFSPELRHNYLKSCAEGFDVLHLETHWSSWLSERQNLSQVVLNIHNLYRIDEQSHAPVDLAECMRRAVRRRAEQQLLRRHRTLMTLTPRLSQAIRTLAPTAFLHVVPLALDLNLYPFVSTERRPTTKTIGLIGTFDWYPTHSAAIRLLTRLWPTIKYQLPDAKLQIVGRNARRALREFLPMADVEVAENVPNIQPHFENINVLLYAPATGSSGMKVKVLEAFAFGVPVVTTSEGVEGLPACDGVHAGICDDEAGLIERTVNMLADSGRQERQRLAARRLVQEHCNPVAALDRVEQCYAGMLARSTGCAA